MKRLVFKQTFLPGPIQMMLPLVVTVWGLSEHKEYPCISSVGSLYVTVCLYFLILLRMLMML